MAFGVAPDARRGGERSRRRPASQAVRHRRLREPGRILGEPTPVDQVGEPRERRTVADLRHRDPQQRRQLDDLRGRCAPTSTRRSPARSRRGAACGTCRARAARRRTSRHVRSSRRSRATAGRSSSAATTQPSAVGCTFGNCDDRTGRNGSPAISYHVTGKSGWLNIERVERGDVDEVADALRACTRAARPARRSPRTCPRPSRPVDPRTAAAGGRACRAARDHRTTPGG